MPQIAISYRRADTSAVAGRIFDRLTAHYGEQAVFMDIDKIPFGTDFRTYVHETLRQSDILIALIGANWLAIDTAGRARMQDESDPVRVEIETAVAANKPIIPVLVDGARMPDGAMLPSGFGNFAYLNAVELTSGREFSNQIGRLIAAIDRTVLADGRYAPLRTESDATQVAANRASGSDEHRWRVDTLRFFLVPLALLLIIHYVIDFNNFNNRFIWLDSLIVPFAFGFAFCWTGGRSPIAALGFAVLLGGMGSVGMNLSNSLISGDPVVPQTSVEWRGNMNVAGVIALSYVAGHALARAARNTRRFGKLQGALPPK